MNFLDLSTASEEERRLIKEILSDTSVINIAEPPTYKHHNKQSSHNHHNQQQQQQHHHHHNNHQQQQQAQQANHNHQPTPHQQHNHQPQQHHPQSQLQHPQKQQHHKFPAHPQPVQNGVVPRDYTTSSSSISTPPLQASPSTTNTATTTPTIPNSTSNVSPLPQPMLPPNLAGQGAAPTNANNVATNHGANNNSQNNIYMTSTQAPPPTGYAIPPPPTHVTAFGPPQLPHPHHSHHVYSGPPLFQPNYYVMYSVPPSCMPYVIPQNTVVSQQTARQQQHLQQEQQQPQPQQSSGSHQINTTNNNRPQNVNSTNSTISSSSNMHPRYRYSAHNHNQQQSHQNLSQRQPRHQQHQNNHQLDLRQQSHHQNHQTQSQPQNQLATHPQLNQKSSLPDDVPAEQVVHLKTQAQHVAISNRQDEITLPKEEESTQLGQIKQDESEITENSSKEDVDYEMKANNHEQSNSEQLKTKDDSQLSQTEVKVPNSNNSSVTSQSEAASASSKSWASLFRAGAGTELVVNGNSEHNNKSESENNSDDEVLKTKSSASPPNSKSSKSHSKSYSNEQRFQEAAKRASDKMAMRFAQRIKTMNLKHSLPFIKPRGFINKGNGCYINATLQALIACPPFYNLMKEIGDLRGFRRDNSCTPILDSFAELFLNFPPLDITKKNKQMNSQDQKPTNIETLQAEAIEPRCIYNVLGLIKSECLRGAQEDAEEFLSSVLNGLHEEMIGLGEILDTKNDPTNQNGNVTDAEESVDDVNNDDNLWREVGPKNRSLPIRTAKMVNTPIQEIFGGSLFSIRTAGKDRCGYRSPFFDLQLDISGDNVKSVQDAIKSFTATEIIHDFYCSKTKQKLDAQRRTSLDQLPPILILHLKQFFYSQDHGLKKLVKKIEYPIDFELPDSCLHEKNSNDKNPWTSRSYKLLAVVYHDGKEAIKGHYLTDVYHIGSSQWIRCDDGNLKVISSPRIDNPESLRTPYLLFYRRLNTLRVQSGNPDSKKQKN